MSTTSLPLPAHRSRALSLPLPRPELAGLLVLAGVLYLWALDRNGFANDYYSAAARSMSTSWHAFLYGSFDVAGVMTVDKPPLALWAQALSARVFGFSSWSLLVPQALMGGAAVGLAYDLTRRYFGRVAGFSAAWRSHSRRSRSRSRATTTPTRCSFCAAPPRCGSSSAGSRTAAPAGSSSPARARQPPGASSAAPATSSSPPSAQDVVAERVAERGHDHPLVERQVGAGGKPESTLTESAKPHLPGSAAATT